MIVNANERKKESFLGGVSDGWSEGEKRREENMAKQRIKWTVSDTELVAELVGNGEKLTFILGDLFENIDFSKLEKVELDTVVYGVKQKLADSCAPKEIDTDSDYSQQLLETWNMLTVDRKFTSGKKGGGGGVKRAVVVEETTLRLIQGVLPTFLNLGWPLDTIASQNKFEMAHVVKAAEELAKGDNEVAVKCQQALAAWDTEQMNEEEEEEKENEEN